MRNAGGILEFVDALFVAFECADEGCLEIHGIAFCLGAGGQDLAFEIVVIAHGGGKPGGLQCKILLGRSTRNLHPERRPVPEPTP
jgi:hypothetical protein